MKKRERGYNDGVTEKKKEIRKKKRKKRNRERKLSGAA